MDMNAKATQIGFKIYAMCENDCLLNIMFISKATVSNSLF